LYTGLGLKAMDGKFLDIKRVISLTLICLLGFSCSHAFSQDDPEAKKPAATTHGSEYDYDLPGEDSFKFKKETKAPPTTTLLKGQLTYVVPHGTPLKLQLATVPAHALHMLDVGMDGKPLPAKLGDEITAKLTEDLYVDDNKVIPEGTVFHGEVSEVLPPRRVYRPGSLKLSFDRLTTPDGRVFAFKAEADNFKKSTMKSKAKGFGIISAYAAGGGIVGALVAYQIFGLHETIAMHGYNIAGGAAAGALLATGYAVMRHGPQAVLEPGDELHMQMNRDLLMPAAEEPKAKTAFKNLPGLELIIERGKVVNDGLDGHILVVDAEVNNKTQHRLSSIDLFLEDSNGNRSPITPSPEDDMIESLFTIEPNTSQHLHLAFAIEYPRLKRQLVWLQHDNHQVCFKTKLP
jgi:3',5'-cyclic AMP phosphodiesterase CpdA